MTHAWGIKRTRKGENGGYLIGWHTAKHVLPSVCKGCPTAILDTRQTARYYSKQLNDYSLDYTYAPVKIQITVREIG